MRNKLLVYLLLLTVTLSAKVVEITTVKQFEEIIAQENRLQVFDLYADWCGPCKILAPVLEEVSNETDKADVYKINTDKLPSLSREFGVRGIPYVVFVKNKSVVNALTGVMPKEAYEQSIEILSGELKNSPDGKLVDGVRQIPFDPTAPIQNIHVYRGDKVELITKEQGALSLPDLEIEGEYSEKATVKFTAKKIGAFPIQFNATSDASKAQRKAWMIVLQYDAPTKETIYKELTESEFEAGLKTEGALLLDVRTPQEFKEDHLENAKLVPVQELEERFSELDTYKNKPIYVYCRSGNRSTVASKMLLDKGFTEVYNLKAGIKAWRKAGKKTVK